MLKIIIAGEAVDLPTDINLTINGENPVFTDDRIPMPYTYPIELPLTRRNLRILSHPERITSSNVVEELPCRILFDEIPIDNGVFVLEETGERISGYFKGADTNQNFDTPMNELPLKFSGNISNMDYCIGADLFSDKPVVFAPIKLFGDVSRGGELVEWRNYINYYVADQHFLRDTFPAVRIGYLLRQIIGDNLVANPFETGDMKKLVVQTLQKKSWAYPNTVAGGTLQDYLPKEESSKFMKEILKLFCASLIIRNNRYSIIFNRDLFTSADRVDWSDKLITPYTLTRNRGRVYKFGYNDTADGVDGDGIEVVEFPANLRSRETDTAPDQQRFRVRQTGQVVDRIRNMETESRWQYDVINSGFGASGDNGSDSYDSTCDIRPMDMTFNYILQARDSRDKDEIYCPQINLSDLSSDKMPRIMIWLGMQYTNGNHKYPYLSSYNFYGLNYSDPEDPTLFPFSLRWEGSDGLLETFHKKFREWTERSKLTIKSDMILSATEIRDLNFLRKYHIKGRDLFLKSFSVNLKYDKIEPAQMEFVES